MHVPKLLECRVALADVVQLPEQEIEVRLGVEITRSVLVLLRVEVLLATRRVGFVFEQFETGVDTPRGGHRRSEDRADGERRRVARLEVGGVDVRRVDEEVRPVVGRHVRRQFREVLSEFGLGVAPREVGVGLLVADLAERGHHLRAGERLGEEDDLGVGLVDLREEPIPEVDRLRVGIVDPEDGHALVDPEPQDPQGLVVDAVGIVVEVDRVDVLILLRRVLGIGDRAVHTSREPLGVLLDPRMIRRRLQREVECDLEAEILRLLHEAVERVEISQIRVDRVMAASGRTDRPWGSWLLGPGVEGVVLALLERAADGVDGRQIDDVETHGSGGLETFVGGIECAGVPVSVLILMGALAAREEFVPRRVQRALALDTDRVFGAGCDELARTEPGHGAHDRARRHQLDDVLDFHLGVLERARRAAQQLRRTVDAQMFGMLCTAFEERLALHVDELHVDVRRELLLCMVHPGAPGVRPALDAVAPVAFLSHPDVCFPDVETHGLDLLHVHAALSTRGGGQNDGSRHRVVAFTEDVGGDAYTFVDDRLDWVGTVLEHRAHAGDGDAAEAAWRTIQTL